MENKKVCSFDYDSTLSIPSVKEFAKMLVDNGVEVWIVTSRFDSKDKYLPEFMRKHNINPSELSKEHDKLFTDADEIGISRDHIVFTNMTPKYLFFKEHPEFIFHLDDDWIEVENINETTEVKSIRRWSDVDWKLECSKLVFDQ